MTLDGKYAVPTVAFHTHAFNAVTKSVVRVAGMPSLQQVYVPHPVQGKTPEQMRAFGLKHTARDLAQQHQVHRPIRQWGVRDIAQHIVEVVQLLLFGQRPPERDHPGGIVDAMHELGLAG